MCPWVEGPNVGTGFLELDSSCCSGEGSSMRMLQGLKQSHPNPRPTAFIYCDLGSLVKKQMLICHVRFVYHAKIM